MDAATRFRQESRRVAYGPHANSFHGNDSVILNHEDSHTQDANERTTLLASHHDSYHSNVEESAWTRHLKHTYYTTQATLCSSYANVLLIFVPLGIIAGALRWNANVVFVLNFFAIIPLASLLSFATEELSIRLGQTLGGLLNATFGNAVELIVSTCRFTA